MQTHRHNHEQCS